MITKLNKPHIYVLIYIYLILFKWSYITLFENLHHVIKVKNKKEIFFKKRVINKKNLFSKRIQIALKKRKFFKNHYNKKQNLGNFFFKKFFFRTLLKNRYNLRKFFFMRKRVRQSKLTKSIFKHSKKISKNPLPELNIQEFTIFNTLLRCQFFLFIRDALLAITNSVVFVNNNIITDHNYILKQGDFIQIPCFKTYFTYLLFCKKLVRRKIALFRYNSWKFFKSKNKKKKIKAKINKKKLPTYFHMLFLYKLNTPLFLEVDFLTLTVFILTLNSKQTINSYYINKIFSFKLFNLYNFKKIN